MRKVLLAIAILLAVQLAFILQLKAGPKPERKNYKDIGCAMVINEKSPLYRTTICDDGSVFKPVE